MSSIISFPTVPFNFQAVVFILIDARKDLTAVMAKRNKDGSQNGNAMQGWDVRTRNRLTKEAGCTYKEAYDYALDLQRAARKA